MKKSSLRSALICLLLITSNCFALNPLNFGSDIKTADPSGHVWQDGKMYLYTSRDKECQPDFYILTKMVLLGILKDLANVLALCKPGKI